MNVHLSSDKSPQILVELMQKVMESHCGQMPKQQCLLQLTAQDWLWSS